MASTAPQTARLNFRLSPEHKTLIERAAHSTGQTVSDFAISSLIEDARRALQEARSTTLSLRDGQRFLQMLEQPPAPNAALKRAATRYKKYRARSK